MPPDHRSARLPGLATALAFVLGACAAAGPAVPSAPTAPDSTSAPGTSTPVPEPVVAEGSSDAWLVVGRRGEDGLRVILASTLEEVYELPVGVPGDLWGGLVAAIPGKSATLVKELTVQPGLPGSTRSVDGAWRLPTIGDDTLPVGVSADGSTIVLVEADVPAGAATSRFAVLARGSATRILELPGALEFDALSPDGSILYVVEHLAGPPEAHYQVRAVDLPAGVIRPAVIVDKRNTGESMGGWPITQLRLDNGIVFTLYRGAEHPFIHVLNTGEAWAICLDLPSGGFDEPAGALDWGLAASAPGGAVFAVNATLGRAVAIDPGELVISRTATFDAPRGAAVITLAKFGHQEGGPVGRRVVAAPDGSTVFAAGAGGIVRLDGERLSSVVQVLDGVGVDALALTPDGSSLYALLQDDGRIVRIDTASGQIVGEVPGDGFDRLVGVVPW